MVPVPRPPRVVLLVLLTFACACLLQAQREIIDTSYIAEQDLPQAEAPPSHLVLGRDFVARDLFEGLIALGCHHEQIAVPVADLPPPLLQGLAQVLPHRPLARNLESSGLLPPLVLPQSPFLPVDPGAEEAEEADLATYVFNRRFSHRDAPPPDESVMPPRFRIPRRLFRTYLHGLREQRLLATLELREQVPDAPELMVDGEPRRADDKILWPALGAATLAASVLLLFAARHLRGKRRKGQRKVVRRRRRRWYHGAPSPDSDSDGGHDGDHGRAG